MGSILSILFQPQPQKHLRLPFASAKTGHRPAQISDWDIRDWALLQLHAALDQVRGVERDDPIPLNRPRLQDWPWQEGGGIQVLLTAPLLVESGGHPLIDDVAERHHAAVLRGLLAGTGRPPRVRGAVVQVLRGAHPVAEMHAQWGSVRRGLAIDGEVAQRGVESVEEARQRGDAPDVVDLVDSATLRE